MTQEKKPHVHAELIKAWADGNAIQFWNGSFWRDCLCPVWYSDYEYRIKPEPIKTERYRRWVSKTNAFGIIRHCVQSHSESGPPKEVIENHSIFVRWIDEDWQEGVIVDA